MTFLMGFIAGVLATVAVGGVVIVIWDELAQ